MKLTIPQELALKHPYDEREADARADSGPIAEHIYTQWISTDVQVRKIFTIAIPAEGRPFWHVSMSVHVRDAGAIFMRGMEMPLRRRLREVGQEMVKGVGLPADADRWDVGEKALHLMRELTDDEIELLGRSDV